jgi:hypothetical protein
VEEEREKRVMIFLRWVAAYGSDNTDNPVERFDETRQSSPLSCTHAVRFNHEFLILKRISLPLMAAEQFGLKLSHQQLNSA